MTIETTIEDQVMQAYADCHGREPFEVTMHKRNLNFKASGQVSRDEAVRIMRKAVSGGYNQFTAGTLQLLPPDSMVTLAREGSVCVYVAPALKRIGKMKADEWSTDEAEGTTRIWWD